VPVGGPVAEQPSETAGDGGVVKSGLAFLRRLRHDES
jgi:hypothetical protein